MEITELESKDKPAWDEYVLSLDSATIYHLSGWIDVMDKSFGLKPIYLVAKEDNQIRGGLPLLHIKSKLSGHFYTSMPGGMCTEDEEVASNLLEHAKTFVREADAQYLILRDSFCKWALPDLITDENHCTFTVKLCGCAEEMWKSLDRRVRQHVDKAVREDLSVVVGAEYLDEFYQSYSRVMREMGTPSFGYSFFQNVFNQFPDYFTTIMVHNQTSVHGGIVAACFKDTVYMMWWGMPRKYYKNRSGHMLNWETLKFGCSNGYDYVDLGRSRKDSGTFVFKGRWPAETRPVYQQFFLNKGSEPPSVGSNMGIDPKYRLFIQLWKHLPQKVTDTVGPQLRRRMPFG
jgi:FemAB-related protein (PEP-CTERM system-associated)